MPGTSQTPRFTTEEAIARLREAVHPRATNFYAMYSSVLGGVVTDPGDGRPGPVAKKLLDLWHEDVRSATEQLVRVPYPEA